MTATDIGLFVPTPSWLSQPFWDNAKRGVLCRQKCADCGYDMFPPQFACRQCLSTNLAWTPSSGRGRIHSFTLLYIGPDGKPLQKTKVLADVDMEEGWHMMTNIVGCEPESVAIGMEVRLTWQELSLDILLPVFEPA